MDREGVAAALHSLPEPGYTKGMKTAISLPDDIYRAAERQARRARKSRSQLYADALSEYLDRHAPEEVTTAMDAVLVKVGKANDPFVSTAAHRVLQTTQW